MAILREVRHKASINLSTYIIRYKLELITKKIVCRPILNVNMKFKLCTFKN